MVVLLCGIYVVNIEVLRCNIKVFVLQVVL